MSELITLDYLKKAIPSRKGAITEDIVKFINDSAQEPEFQGESLLQTMITYEAVMVNNKVGIKDYINAIRFCAYLIAQDDNYTEAYTRTFFDREFVKKRKNAPTTSVEYRELTSAASRYRKSKLVTDILSISQVPLDLMFTGARYRAIAVLADRMESSKLDKDKIQAADRLLTHTTPKDFKIELDLGVTENSATTDLMDQLAVMASRQKELLEAGVNDLNDFGAMKPRDQDLLEGEAVEIKDEEKGN